MSPPISTKSPEGLQTVLHVERGQRGEVVIIAGDSRITTYRTPTTTSTSTGHDHDNHNNNDHDNSATDDRHDNLEDDPQDINDHKNT